MQKGRDQTTGGLPGNSQSDTLGDRGEWDEDNSGKGKIYVGRWDGKLSVRSGTARISIVPTWDDDVPLEEGLAPFPGAQMQITIPERVAR